MKAAAVDHLLFINRNRRAKRDTPRSKIVSSARDGENRDICVADVTVVHGSRRQDGHRLRGSVNVQHCPSGRVGLSGPERGFWTCEQVTGPTR